MVKKKLTAFLCRAHPQKVGQDLRVFFLSVWVCVHASPQPLFRVREPCANFRLGANVAPLCDRCLPLMFISHFHCRAVCSEISVFVLDKGEMDAVCPVN